MKETAAGRVSALVVEDEENLSQSLSAFLRGRGHHVVSVADSRGALQALRDESFDVVLLDLGIRDSDGLELVRHIRADIDPPPPEVIVMTGSASVETAITGMKLGAYDYLSKPYRMAEVDVVVRRACEKLRLARENRSLHARLSRVDATPEVVTQYAPMHAVLSLLKRVAPNESPVLITGESGTGKRLLARAIHRLSGRSGAMVEVDSAVVTEAVLESELFGHDRGSGGNGARAATGVGGGGGGGGGGRKAGLIELAANGTLLVEEVGSLSQKLQAKLSRALESGSFVRIGGTQKVEIAMRLITSSTRDLRADVVAGDFRAELLERLNVVTVSLPPLRERVSDISLLARHFLGQLGGGGAPSLTTDAIEVLESYAWPGNVRELRALIERSFLLTRGRGEIRAQDLPLTATGPSRSAAREPLTLLELERQHIWDVLTETKWHQGEAARLLGISEKTLYRKIREFGFQRPRRAAGRGTGAGSGGGGLNGGGTQTRA
ncbi:MAG TPA: sigma-54 dependent transcriptional regulator [Gemmatimonadaceae bacterium]